MVRVGKRNWFVIACELMLFASVAPNVAFAGGVFKTIPDLIDKEWVDK